MEECRNKHYFFYMMVFEDTWFGANEMKLFAMQSIRAKSCFVARR